MSGCARTTTVKVQVGTPLVFMVERSRPGVVRLASVPELANRVLRVIISNAEPRRILTAHLDRNLKGKL